MWSGPSCCRGKGIMEAFQFGLAFGEGLWNPILAKRVLVRENRDILAKCRHTCHDGFNVYITPLSAVSDMSGIQISLKEEGEGDVRFVAVTKRVIFQLRFTADRDANVAYNILSRSLEDVGVSTPTQHLRRRRSLGLPLYLQGASLKQEIHPHRSRNSGEVGWSNSLESQLALLLYYRQERHNTSISSFVLSIICLICLRFLVCSLPLDRSRQSGHPPPPPKITN